MPLTKEELNFVDSALNSPSVRRVAEREIASRWRSDVTADWLSNFLDTMTNKAPLNTLQDVDPTLNKQTGQRHSLESMVGDLRDRVQLDILKEANLSDIPLSAHGGLYDLSQADDGKDDDALLEDIAEYVSTYFMKPQRGHVDYPAVVDACKDKYGEERLLSLDSDKLKQVILDARDHFRDDSATEALAPYNGDPQPVGHGLDDNDKMENLSGPTVFTK